MGLAEKSEVDWGDQVSLKSRVTYLHPSTEGQGILIRLFDVIPANRAFDAERRRDA